MFHIRQIAAHEIPILKDFAPPEWNTDVSKTFAFHFGRPYFYAIACEWDGRLVGCANALTQGQTGWFGNILVLPDYRGHGVGRALTEHLIAYFAAQGVKHQVLIATKMGQAVYSKLGFEVVSQYVFLRREAQLPAEEVPGTRPFRPEDAVELFALDRSITGEERQPFLSRFFEDAWVHQSPAGRVDGFFLPGLAQGPVLAANEAAGLALLRLKLGQGASALAVPEANTQAISFLRAQGFEETGRAPRMSRGPDVAWQPEQVFARGSGYCG